MIVEPMAGDRVEDNLNPVGRAYYGFSTFLCTPASLSQDVGLALGAQAGEARIRDVVSGGGFTPFPAAARDALQPRVRGATVSTTSASDAASAGRASRHRRPRRPRPTRRADAGTYPTRGYIERDGVRVFYEVYGDGEPTILLLPTWSLVHSRIWKMQIPYLARHFRVVTFDGRGKREVGPPRAPPPTPSGVRGGRAWRSWTRPAPSGR